MKEFKEGLERKRRAYKVRVSVGGGFYVLNQGKQRCETRRYDAAAGSVGRSVSVGAAATDPHIGRLMPNFLIL